MRPEAHQPTFDHHPISPRVSAFMAVYNGENWIDDAVTSVLAQTEVSFELLIIDDGSTDSTGRILDRIDDPRVHVWHKENEGLGTALNPWLRRCRGKYIMRLDADDLCDPTRMEMQADFLDEHQDVIIAGCQFRHFVGERRGSATSLPLDHDTILQGMRRGVHTMSHATTMWRRSLLDKIDGYGWDGPGEDWSLLFDAVRHGNLANLADPLYMVRLHADSSSAGGARRVIQGFAFARERYEQFLQGVEDYTPEQFEAESQNGLISRLVEGSRARSLLVHRRAQVAMFEGETSTYVTLLAVAILLDPRKAVGALWKRFRVR